MPWIGSINCNFRDYSDGKTVSYGGKSYDLTWATAREARLASLLKNDGRCSIYCVSECDTTMMKGLCTRLGSTWKHIGGDNYYTDSTDGDAQDKCGFLYDSAKFSWDALVNYNLPDGGTRQLLGVTFTSLSTAENFVVFTTHLDPGNPTGRAAQISRVLQLLNGRACVFAGDLNAQSTTFDSSLAENEQGPRVQLARAGWAEAPYQPAPFYTFQNYGGTGPGRIDYFGVSPKGVTNGITITDAEIVDGLKPPSGSASALGTDHNLIRALVTL